MQGMSPAAVQATESAVRRVMEPIIELVGSESDGGNIGGETDGGRSEDRKAKGKGKKSTRGYAYANEGDWTEPEWEEVFYGRLYERLLKVKRRWDPRGVLGCWKCVGWEEGKGIRKDEYVIYSFLLFPLAS